MIDAEKVIEGLEHCVGEKPCAWTKCPYHDKWACREALERDALSLLRDLLKKQKPTFWDSMSEEDLYEPMRHFRD